MKSNTIFKKNDIIDGIFLNYNHDKNNLELNFPYRISRVLRSVSTIYFKDIKVKVMCNDMYFNNTIILTDIFVE